MHVLYIGILVVAAIAWLVQGRIAPKKLLATGTCCFILSLTMAALAYPYATVLSDAAIMVYVLVCGWLGMLGVLLAVPAASLLFFKR